MNKWEIIKEKCPKLYRNGISFDCGYGWYELLYNLSVKIESIIEDDEKRYPKPEIEMCATQVKEKYGTLRFYMTCETSAISELIEDAEALSSQVCEICGSPGKIRGYLWFRVVCDKCYKEQDERP